MIAPGGHRSGSAVRIAATVRALSVDHEVTVVLVAGVEPPDPGVVQRCASWCKHHGVDFEVVRAPSTPAQATVRAVRLWLRSVAFNPHGHRRGVPARLRALVAGADLVWVFHLYPFMAGAVPAHGCTVVDIDDLKERLDPAGPGALALGRRVHLSAVRRLRRQVASAVRLATVSSPDDLDHLAVTVPAANLALLPNTADDPKTGNTAVPHRGAPRVVMVGNLSYRPNAQGAAWFMDRVWPRIRAAVPSATFVLIGAGAGAVKAPGAGAGAGGSALDGGDRDGRDGVEVLGEVGDLADELSRATVSVAPVLAGTGTRVKIVEAFAWGLPVVSTSIGAGGLDVVDGQDLLLADDPEGFAAAVIGVLDDPVLAQRLGASGRAVFTTNHEPGMFSQTVRLLSRRACDASADAGADAGASISVDGSIDGGADRRSDGSTRLDITQVVLTRRFAGIERHVTTVAAALAARGHRVRIVCPDPDVMATGFSSAAQRSTVELVAAETWRRAAWEVARRPSTDVVHTHSTGSLVAAVVGLVGRSTPLVVTRHFTSVRWSDADGQGRRIARLRDPGLGQAQPGRIRAAVQRWVDSRIDQQVAVSTFVADNIAQPAQVIHPGIQAPPHLVPAAQRQQRVLVLQRLEPDKATDVALRAWAASDLRHHGWMLDVVGDGSLGHALEDLVVELGLEDSVVMHGHVANVASLLDGAALLVAPAASEPFGLSVVEAMAAGVPVVAAGSGGHLETLGRVDGAGLFAPGDAAGAGALMDRLGPDVDVRQRLADAQCAVQQQYFDLHGQVAVMEGFYRHLARG